MALLNDDYVLQRKTCRVNFSETYVNSKCLLARNGFKPYERCDYCTLQTPQCMGMQSTAFIFAISFFSALFLFLSDPLLIRLNIIIIVGLVFWLGYKVMLSTDQLAKTDHRNCELNTQLTEYNETLEHEVDKRTRQLQKMATEDTLTGLLNRLAFERQLKQVMKHSKEQQTEHALCYLDLDQFKVVNDTCGHIAGDQMLRQIAVLLKKSIKEDDIVARLGGDEFGIIFKNLSSPDAQLPANRLLQAINEFRFHWEGKTFGVGASIGMVDVNNDSCTTATLLSQADTACYAAKDEGRNRIHVATHKDSVVEERRDQMQWISKIEKALQENRFELYAQPIVDIIDDSSVAHYEVLVRMRSKNGKIIPPMAFIPAAERYGRMVELDRWVIQHLFAHYASMSKNEKEKIRFSVNISGISLNSEEMSEFIIEMFDKYNVPFDVITFEITETAAIANLNSALKFIDTFRAYGCTFSLDDFGCGLSSFSYLQNLPVDYLKIDGSFVVDIDTNDVNRAMVDAIIQIGHVMGIQTVCEFVENASVLTVLKSLGVDYAQGYHIGKPAPIATLKAEG